MAVVAVVAGVDPGKASLDVSVCEGPVLRFDNTTKGITRLLRHLAKQEATLVVCESTGGTSGCWSVACGRSRWGYGWPTPAG